MCALLCLFPVLSWFHIAERKTVCYCILQMERLCGGQGKSKLRCFVPFTHNYQQVTAALLVSMISQLTLGIPTAGQSVVLLYLRIDTPYKALIYLLLINRILWLSNEGLRFEQDSCQAYVLFFFGSWSIIDPICWACHVLLAHSENPWRHSYSLNHPLDVLFPRRRKENRELFQDHSLHDSLVRGFSKNDRKIAVMAT